MRTTLTFIWNVFILLQEIFFYRKRLTIKDSLNHPWIKVCSSFIIQDYAFNLNQYFALYVLQICFYFCCLDLNSEVLLFGYLTLYLIFTAYDFSVTEIYFRHCIYATECIFEC